MKTKVLTICKPTTNTRLHFDLKYYLCRNSKMGNRYFIFLRFRGTHYHGWQDQSGSLTVQKIVNEALSMITREKISTTGAGRTDSGVHARFFCAHFDSSQNDLATRKNFVYRLNRYLPEDISVTGIQMVVPDAHARYSAISRTYEYYISLSKDPFLTNSAWNIHGDLDIVAMNRAARMLLLSNDFTSFSRLHSDNKSNICKVFHAYWEKENERLIFTIMADRFLRNMVRAIVGTIVEVGKNKITVRDFNEIINARDRSAAGSSAPARGLFLTNVEYPEGIFCNASIDLLKDGQSG